MDITYIGMHPALRLSVSHAAPLLALVFATIGFLFGPKFLAVAILARDAAAAKAHGGRLAIFSSTIAESVFSTLFAPIVMLSHSFFVVSILLGASSGWNSQHRQDRALPPRLVARHFWPHTLAGVLASAFLLAAAPHAFWWFLPLLAGLVLAIPLISLTSSFALGLGLKRAGLFLVPSETRGLAVLARAHALAAARPDPDIDMRRLVLENAMVRALHVSLLFETPPLSPRDPGRLADLIDRARARELAGFTREDWMLLLSDPESLRRAAEAS